MSGFKNMVVPAPKFQPPRGNGHGGFLVTFHNCTRALRKNARHSFVVLFAVWFVFISAAIQNLHKHTATQCQSDTTGREAFSEHIDDYHVIPAGLSSSGGADQGSRSGMGLCPVCLFLKNCNERAIVWQSPEPPKTADRHTGRPTTVLLPAPVVVSSSPRAPPDRVA